MRPLLVIPEESALFTSIPGTRGSPGHRAVETQVSEAVPSTCAPRQPEQPAWPVPFSGC